MKQKLLAISIKTAVILASALAGFLLSGPINDMATMFGSTPQQHSARAAWSNFASRIEDLGHRILQDDFPNQTDRQRAEGIRQLAHVIVDGIKWEFDNANAEFTGLTVINTDTTGWGGPNVDNKYIRGRIDGKSTYLLTGNINNIYDIAIQTNKGDLHMGQIGTSKTLDRSTLIVDDNGDFTVTISPESHDGNWIQQGPDHSAVTLRVYYLDWNTHQPAQFHLIKKGNEGLAPPPLTEREAAQRLANATHWIEANLIGWDKWLKVATVNDKDNQPRAPRSVDGGSATLLYGSIPFNLAPGEAMIIEVEDPQARYFSFQTYNYGWFDAGDYAHRQTSLNNLQTHISSDGMIRLVVAADDPGISNWIDTEGRQRALVTYRYMSAKNPHKPTVSVVPFEALADHLPADTARISPQQRKAVIASRQRHVQLRFHN